MGSIATIMLFCIQAYWLSLQYGYNLDQKTQQFKTYCNQVLQTETKNRKAFVDKIAAKQKKHQTTMKIESQYAHNKKWKSETAITFYENGKQILQACEPAISISDAFEACDRYTAYNAKQPNAQTLKTMLEEQGYTGLHNFKRTKFGKFFMTPQYEISGKWPRTVTVSYQTNPLLHEGISFTVPIPISPILKSMLWQLVISITLFVILAICMFYLIHTIVVQKRINGIRHEFLKHMIYEMKQPKQDSATEEDAITIGTATFRYTQNELHTPSERIIITSRQAEILRLLALRQNQLVERDTILNEVWGDDSYSNSLALNVQITYLRRALSSVPDISIEAIIKKGYILRTTKTEEPTEQQGKVL